MFLFVLVGHFSLSQGKRQAIITLRNRNENISEIEIEIVATIDQGD
jgi:hypothetical protein